MKMSITWKGLSGGHYELVAEQTMEMRSKTVWLDGHEVTDDPKPVIKSSSITLYQDGREVDHRDNCDTYCYPIRDQKYIKMGITHSIGKVGIPGAELAAKIDQLLRDVRAGSKVELLNSDKDAAAIEAEEVKADREAAEEIIKAAKATTIKRADGNLMTNAQAETWKRNYNNANNEGGEGYVPRVITQEMYDAAIKTLTK